MPTLQIPPWPAPVFTLGNTAIIARPKTAFLCSRNYPAVAVLRIYDWAQAARERGECVISGFHSALERDVLEILLGGEQPLILAAARSLPRRLAPALRDAMKKDHLLVLSPFPQTTTRITAATARKRNEFMLTITNHIVIGHLSAGGALAETVSRIAPRKKITRLSPL
ncbi:MAG: DNA-binding protein [Gammaproteobacteria bacterium]|nr:DNA-binding protein [Gammaproteobacteria bacterium]